jgi:hypothetical protein
MFGTDYDEASGYEEFRIELLYDTSQKRFKLRASSATGETMPFDYYPPVTSSEIEEAFAGVARANAQFSLSVPRSTADEIRALGERLYNSVWQNLVTDLYQRSCAVAQASGKNLRLRFVTNDQSMAALPWEFLVDPLRKDFLTLSTRTPVARQWIWPNTPPHARPVFVEPPLRVLVVEAEVRPWDIGAQEEIASLKKLEDRHHPVLKLVDVVSNATPRSFLTTLKQRPYHVLHLCLSGATPDAIPGRGTGSGNYGSASLPESLLFMDDESRTNRNPQRVDLDTLLSAIGMQPDLQLIYLSGDCTDWLASQLTQVSPATLGWRGLNTPEAYLSFTRGFYSALTKGLPLESAVTHGRKSIDAEYPGGKEWGMPVFYLQTPDGIAVRQPKRAQPDTGQGEARVLSDGPSNPADQRKWTKVQVLLSVAEENYRVLLGEVRKYVDDKVPDHVNSQVQELENEINSLRTDLERLAK